MALVEGLDVYQVYMKILKGSINIFAKGKRARITKNEEGGEEASLDCSSWKDKEAEGKEEEAGAKQDSIFLPVIIVKVF